MTSASAHLSKEYSQRLWLQGFPKPFGHLVSGRGKDISSGNHPLLTLSSFNYQLCRIRWRKNKSNTVADSNHQHLQLSREVAPPLDIQDAIVTSLGFGVMMHL